MRTVTNAMRYISDHADWFSQRNTVKIDFPIEYIDFTDKTGCQSLPRQLPWYCPPKILEFWIKKSVPAVNGDVEIGVLGT